jgi:hypothetical protein
MKIFYFVLVGVLVILALSLPIWLLIFSPTEWLVYVKDASIIYASLFMCVGAIVFIVLTGLIAIIAFTIRDKISPALDKANDTLQTVKGTATFVSESVVAPIIKTAGAAAGAKAMVQTLLRRNPPKPKAEEKQEEKKEEKKDANA